MCTAAAEKPSAAGMAKISEVRCTLTGPKDSATNFTLWHFYFCPNFGSRILLLVPACHFTQRLAASKAAQIMRLAEGSNLERKFVLLFSCKQN